MSGTLSSKDPGCIFVADDQYHKEENKKEIKPVAKKMKLPAAKKMKLSDALQKISAGDVNDNLDSNFEKGISLDPIVPPIRSIRAKKR